MAGVLDAQSAPRRGRAYRTSALSIPNNTSTPVDWTDAGYNVGGTWWTTGSRLTVPTDCTVLIATSIDFASNLTGVRAATIRKNGTESLVDDVRGAISTHLAIALAVVDVASAGDYYETIAYQSSGGPLNIVITSFQPSLTIASI